MSHGSCLCGAIAFSVEPPFTTFQYCHCTRCRKKSGSAHCANIFVPVAQFAWTRGGELVKRFELPNAARFCSGFCPTCGSSMPWLNRAGTGMVVPAGALDDDPGQRPARNVQFASRAPWYEPVSSLPTFDASP